MPIQTNGLDYRKWKFKQTLILVIFNHQNKCNLTLSNSWWMVHSLFLKILLFLSFHNTQTQHNQTSSKKKDEFARPRKINKLNNSWYNTNPRPKKLINLCSQKMFIGSFYYLILTTVSSFFYFLLTYNRYDVYIDI